MIQRKQSLYLLAVLVLSILLFTGPLAFITTKSGGIYLQHSGAFDLEGNKLDMATWPLTVMISIASLLSLYALLSYKRRPRQMRLCIFLMLFDAGMIGMISYYIWYVMNQYQGIQYVFQWRIVLPAVMLILLYLAFKGVQRDELLIKSYERIR